MFIAATDVFTEYAIEFCYSEFFLVTNVFTSEGFETVPFSDKDLKFFFQVDVIIDGFLPHSEVPTTTEYINQHFKMKIFIFLNR